jgi:glycosyltransferase involved in cell wall biosynthesis
MVAHRFPPLTGGGVIRPAKMAKYLARDGERVTVVTASDPSGRRDESLLQGLPASVRVVRVREEGAVAALFEAPPGGPGRLRREARRALRALAWHWQVPDLQRGFVQPALAAARGSGSPDLVFATGRPWSSFLAGAAIARELDIPLVLDYRDPWTAGPPGWANNAGLRARRTDPVLERSLVQRAAAITTAHETLPVLMEERLRLPDLGARCHWIPNGYDPEDFEGVEPRRSDRFVLTYAGALYGSRSLEPVLRALQSLSEEGRVDPSTLRVRILGPAQNAHRAEMTAPTLRGLVEMPGHVPHREVLASILGSTVNLLVDIRYEGPNLHFPGKLFEYLRAGRPILAATPEGVTADLVEEARAGWVVAPEDHEGMKAALAAAYAAWKHGAPMPRPLESVVERFDRRRSVQRLAALFRSLVESPAASAASRS